MILAQKCITQNLLKCLSGWLDLLLFEVQHPQVEDGVQIRVRLVDGELSELNRLVDVCFLLVGFAEPDQTIVVFRVDLDCPD